ncbi:MAG: ABC transporter permease [Bacteroidetes bacterium]|nr:ABC transporter permease [Bacteroidota bacterium]
MFRNFITIAFRNLVTHKAYSLINISGLAIGLASAILILLYVQDELSYDKFHDNYDQIYRVGLHSTKEGNELIVAVTNVPLAPTLVRDYPEVISTTRMFAFVGEPIVRYKENSFLEDRFFYADSSFFGVFTKGLLKGDPATVLARSNTVVITDEMANKYFGSEEPIGKVIEVGIDRTEFEVTGVVKKYPGNSHIKFDFLGSLESMEFINSTNWLSYYIVYTYFQLQEGYSPEQLEAKFPDMVKKYVGPQWEQIFGIPIEESFGRGVKYGYFLQAVTDIHLGSDMEGELEPGGNVESIYIFSLIALFLIIIASINFMNLATAQSSTRAREVGIRKVAGSTKSKLISQFLTESVLLSYVALLVGIVLVLFALPYFNILAGKELILDLVHNKLLIPSLLILGLIVGLLSGSYPAFFLASLQPVKVLQGKIESGLKSRYLRGILVIFQFSVAIILFISTILVSRQMNFIQKKELGFDKENLVVVNRVEVLQDQKDAFQEELSKFPDVIQSGFTNSLPGIIFGNNTFRPEGTTAESTYSINHWIVGYDLQKTLKMKMNEGRWFSREILSDTLAVVMNEAAAKLFGMEDPVGKNLLLLGGAGDGDLPLKIIGIINDFHYESLHQTIHPLVISFLPSQYSSFLVVRIQPENYQRTVNLIKWKWDEFAPEQPFEYSFLGDDLATAYNNDFRSGTIFTIFAVLAIFISLLGLTGLASYTTAQRTKEIGVRKVFGAKVSEIIGMLSKEVFIFIGISTVIAWPAGYYFMKSWLQNFAFSVDPGFLSFLMASLIALLIAILTVGLRAYKAATANPADSLRYE